MNNTEQCGVAIKSNVTLKSSGVLPPIDNMPNEYFDVRLEDALNQHQKALKIKMMFWANEIRDVNNNLVKDDCFKGCQNCGETNNHCKRPPNFIKLASK